MLDLWHTIHVLVVSQLLMGIWVTGWARCRTSINDRDSWEMMTKPSFVSFSTSHFIVNCFLGPRSTHRREQNGPKWHLSPFGPRWVFLLIFFIIFLQLTCFFGFMYVLMMPLPQNHDTDWHSHQHPEPLPRATAHRVGTGATQNHGTVQTNDGDNKAQGQNNDGTRQQNMRRQTERKKGPRDVIWHLLGCWYVFSFFSFHWFLLTIFF